MVLPQPGEPVRSRFFIGEVAFDISAEPDSLLVTYVVFCIALTHMMVTQVVVARKTSPTSQR